MRNNHDLAFSNSSASYHNPGTCVACPGIIQPLNRLPWRGRAWALSAGLQAAPRNGILGLEGIPRRSEFSQGEEPGVALGNLLTKLMRVEIIRDLRLGAFDVLIGINLLREGLDIPECALVAILDADKEGFLRSETSLIQTIGRAARNVDGKVVLYADRITGSMERAMAETTRRREKQKAYNEAHGITPASIKKHISDIMGSMYERDHVTVDSGLSGMAEEGAAFIGHNMRAHITDLEKQMREAAGDLEFEKAGRLRDEIKRLQAVELTIADDPFARQEAVAEAGEAAVRGDKKPSSGRSRMKRAGRPNVPKTFGSRSR